MWQGVCWGVVYWCGAAALAALPVFWVPTNALHDVSWDMLARVYSGHLYRDFALFTLVLTGVGAFDAFGAAMHRNQSPDRDPWLVLGAAAVGVVLFVFALAFMISYGVALAYAIVPATNPSNVPFQMPLLVFACGLALSLLAKIIAEVTR